MTELMIHNAVIGFLVISGLSAFFTLLFITAPYGRHNRSGWGPSIPSKWGWIIMESPAVLLFLPIFFAGSHWNASVPIFLCVLWQAHYIHRTYIYPFRIRTPSKPMPVVVMLLAFVFQCLNAYVNARWISHLGDTYTYTLLSPSVLAGAALFGAGVFINQWSDYILINLRQPGETEYKIPYGGFFQWITCPNYFGEILIWCGWAWASWSVAGWTFAFFTIANLVPRALKHHSWIRTKFVDYPAQRKAVLPFLL